MTASHPPCYNEFIIAAVGLIRGSTVLLEGTRGAGLVQSTLGLGITRRSPGGCTVKMIIPMVQRPHNAKIVTVTMPVKPPKKPCRNGVMMSNTANVPPVVVNGKPYTRRQIADAVGLDITTISKYFSGTRRPSTSAALRLASYFGISMEELLINVFPFAKVGPGPSTGASPVPPPSPLAEAV